MPQQQVLDARAGLRAEAIATWRTAEQVAVASKDHETAVIGCWTSADSEPTLVLVRTHDLGELLSISITDAQHDLWWRFIVDGCRPGDIPILEWWGSRLALKLTKPVTAAVTWRAAQGAQGDPLIVGDARRERARDFPLWDADLRRRPRVGESDILTHKGVLT